MNLFKRIIEIVDFNLIYCLIPIILTLMIAELSFRKRFETKKVMNIISKIIIVYTILILVYSLIGMIFYPEKFAFLQSATDLYGWIMFIFASILPLTLIFRKLSSNFFYVLFISIFMKIGYYFERYVIAVTSYRIAHRMESHNAELVESFLFGLLISSIQGILIAFISLGIFEVIKKLKNKGFTNGL